MLKWAFLIKSLFSLTFHIFIFFSRTTELISTKLGTKHPWVKGIQVCSNEKARSFPRGDNYEISENTLSKFKNLSLQNHCANFNQTWHKASLGERDSSFFKWRAPTHFHVAMWPMGLLFLGDLLLLVLIPIVCCPSSINKFTFLINVKFITLPSRGLHGRGQNYHELTNSSLLQHMWQKN